MNKKMIAYTLGRMLLLEGILMCLPGLIAVGYHEPNMALDYFGCALFSGLCGVLISYKKPRDDRIYAREGYLIVALAWIALSVFGALPFVFSGEIPSYVDAFFEIVSGFTTTGSSILTNIEGLSHASLFWRSFSHWIGGMGILVFVVAVLPDSSGSSLHILRAEMPGPIVGKLVSKVKATAQILYRIYLAMTLFETLLLVLGGMPLFDSLLNSFGTAGTGGFAIKNSSIAFYDSAYADAIITIFMFLFGVNFNLFYFLLIGHFREVFKNEELRAYTGIVAVAIVLLTCNLFGYYGNIFKALRYAAFQVVSIITTTGFVTADYGQWPVFSQAILLVLMFIGASAGSTGGGMKVSRVLIGFKSAKAQLLKAVHPRRVHAVYFEGESLSEEVISGVHAYFVFYFMILFLSFLVLSLQNIDLLSAFSATVTCLNNVGPGFNIVGPVGNFSTLSDLSKLVLCFDMLAGRLEIFPMLSLFFRDTRD